uniref:(northern house mosquito) hypothetical protein n=1 Tax=Culex pipiens TaxID=7175 RepID=A0A8D8NED2_CULPI
MLQDQRQFSSTTTHSEPPSCFRDISPTRRGALTSLEFTAEVHVDNVRLPSWQSQLKGAKEWILAPPPECYYSCDFLSVVVQTGDTIVLDTNKWYHKTNVLSGEISITVGAEYD